MRKSKVFDGSEPRLALYSSLITHFRHFRKNRKIDAKREPKSIVFCSKNGPLALQGRLILSFWSIFEDSKNHCFFDVVLGRQKIDKNRALGRQRPKTSLRVLAEWEPGGILWSPGLPGRRPLSKIFKEYKGSRIAKQTLTRHGPLARRISISYQ